MPETSSNRDTCLVIESRPPEACSEWGAVGLHLLPLFSVLLLRDETPWSFLARPDSGKQAMPSWHFCLFWAPSLALTGAGQGMIDLFLRCWQCFLLC